MKFIVELLESDWKSRNSYPAASGVASVIHFGSFSPVFSRPLGPWISVTRNVCVSVILRTLTTIEIGWCCSTCCSWSCWSSFVPWPRVCLGRRCHVATIFSPMDRSSRPPSPRSPRGLIARGACSSRRPRSVAFGAPGARGSAEHARKDPPRSDQLELENTLEVADCSRSGFARGALARMGVWPRENGRDR